MIYLFVFGCRKNTMKKKKVYWYFFNFSNEKPNWPLLMCFWKKKKKNRPALFIPANRPNTKWLNLKNPPKTHTLSSAFFDSLWRWLTLGATAPLSPQRRKHSSLLTADHLVLHITLYPTFSFSINYFSFTIKIAH